MLNEYGAKNKFLTIYVLKYFSFNLIAMVWNIRQHAPNAAAAPSHELRLMSDWFFGVIVYIFIRDRTEKV